MKKLLCCCFLTFLIVVMLCANDFAQVADPMRFSLNAGVSLPQGDFGSTSGKTAGYATTGFCAALDATKMLSETASWVSTFNLSLNKMDESIISSQIGGLSVSTGYYATSWIMTGFGFETPVSLVSNLYAVGQIGALYSNFPDITISSGGSSITQTTTSSLTFALGFIVGIKFEKVKIGVRYYYGNPEYEESVSSGGSTTTAKETLPASVLQLMLGINL